MLRHTAGLAWAYNTRLFFQTYYPDFDIGGANFFYIPIKSKK